MKTTKLFFTLLALLTFCTPAFSQNGNNNGNAVVSEVEVQDMGNGTAMITVRISGNQAYTVTGGTFEISGDRIAGGSAGGGIGTESRVFIQPVYPGNGNSNGNQPVLLAGLVSLESGSENGNDQVDMTFHLRRIGNGLDYTYVCRRQIRRISGI
jgi:hypothetical protein